MKTGTIKAKHFKSAPFRIDPSFHLSEGIKVRSMLENVPYGLTTVKEASDDVFIGNIFSRVFVKDENHGVPYLAASDTVLANLDTGRFLSFKQASELSYLILQKDWILATCSGTLGNVSYTNSEFAGKIATHDLIRIVPNDKKILRGCLYAFLASKYGYYQLTESMFGGVVKHINADHVASIKVPCFPKDFQIEVDACIKEAAKFREDAYQYLEEAKLEIQKYLGLNYYKCYGMQCRRLKSSDVVTSFKTRLDSPIYLADAVSFIKRLSVPTKLLGDCSVHMWYPGIFKRTYVQDGLPYMQGSSLLDRDPFKRCDTLSKTKTPKLDQLWLKEGQLLITCAGSCGDVKIITKEYDEKQAIGSPDIIRVTSDDSLVSLEYLYAYLQLDFVHDFIQAFKYGSVIERFDIQNLETLPIAVPTEALSKRVTELINKQKNCIYKAFKNEEKAINSVNFEILKWSNKS